MVVGLKKYNPAARVSRRLLSRAEARLRAMLPSPQETSGHLDRRLPEASDAPEHKATMPLVCSRERAGRTWRQELSRK